MDIEQPAPISRAKALRSLSGLKSFFKKQGVELFYLHGSLARDELKTLSDIDLAVLLSPRSSAYKKMGILYHQLAETLGREDVDIMILNQASPLACMQVLSGGKLIYCRNDKVLTQFRLKTIQRYLSTSYLRTSFNRYVEAVILGKKH